MHIWIDLGIVLIIAFFAWRGYKNGFIRSIFGIAALIAALFIANIAASAYSEEFTGMLNPFIGGVVDTTLGDMVEDETYTAVIVRETGEGALETSLSLLRRIGLSEPASERVAEMVSEAAPGRVLTEIVTERLSSAFAYIAVFGIAFLLLMIIFSVVGNLINLVFSLPGLRLLDVIAGAMFGLLKGLLIVFTFAAVFRYIGLLAPSLFEDATLLNFFVNSNPIARIFGI